LHGETNQTRPSPRLEFLPGDKTMNRIKSIICTSLLTAAMASTTMAGNITTLGNITTAPGNITTAPGNITTAPGNITTAPGNITTIFGNITTIAELVIMLTNAAR